MLKFLDNKRSVFMHQYNCLAAIKFLFFISKCTTLFALYEKSSIIRCEKKSFENCYPFIYYLEHGKNYYQLLKRPHSQFSQCCYFMELAQLFKACLLTVNPNIQNQLLF